MRTLRNILLFQRRIIFYSYGASILLMFLSGGNLWTVAFVFTVMAPLVQYLIYEIKDKHEYFYYYNAGLSKRILWISTVLIALINFCLFAIIWKNFT